MLNNCLFMFHDYAIEDPSENHLKPFLKVAILTTVALFISCFLANTWQPKEPASKQGTIT